MNTKPKISIVCWTYNQSGFIAQTIEGFLMQKTDFPFEIIVHDDASTDGTTGIIKKYEKENPDIIKPIYQKVNQFSNGTSAFINQSLHATKGDYIALCEGDDYWTDSKKLQLQVDFLESHPTYSMCFHPVKVVFQNGEEEDTVFPVETSGFTRKKLLERNFIQTNSVLYRRQQYEHLPIDIMPRDWYLHLYHASFGKIGFINRVMSVYRRHPGGVWWDQSQKPELIWKKYGYNYLRLLHEIMLLYGEDDENRKIINEHVAGSYEAIASIKSQDVADSIAVKALPDLPSETWDYIKHLMQQVDHYSKHDAYLQSIVEREELINKQLAGQLNAIKSSKAWKAIRVARFGNRTAKRTINSTKRAANHLRTRAKHRQE